MKRGFLALVTALPLMIGIPASAQFMYIDVDGDGTNSPADYLLPSVTSIDIYLATDKSLADPFNPSSGLVSQVCKTDPSPLTISSYQIILTAPVGGVTYGAWTDNMGFTIDVGSAAAGYDIVIGRASATPQPPGTYKLGTLAVTVTGYPFLTFATSTTISDQVFTAFGSECGGVDYDNTLKYGTDWLSIAYTRFVGEPISATETTWGRIKMLYH